MKITYLKLSLLAVLVAGATMIISCEKESEINNEVSTIETKNLSNGEPNPLPDEPMYQPILIDPYYLWWTYRIEVDAEGNEYQVWYCTNLQISDSLCAVSINEPIPDLEVELGYANVDLLNRKISQLVINMETIDSEHSELYFRFLERGFITFHENCNITHDKLQDLIDIDYISAGSYLVHEEDSKFVIELEDVINTEEIE